jgi:serine/threonine protein kinase
VWGSPHYFAPEQARGEKPTPASDVYAIGIVMFEMLTGRLPYTGSSQQELAMAHLREAVPKVIDLNPSIPENLSKIVYKVMAKDASQRYRMADQLGHILTSYKDRSNTRTENSEPAPQVIPPVERPPSIPEPPRRPEVLPESNPPVSSQKLNDRQRTPEQAAPTMRFGPAPVAPQPQQYHPRPNIQDSQALVRSNAAPWEARQEHSSQLYMPPDSYEVPSSSRLDFVTVALAILALIAVFGLIPLYIIVWRAWSGG